MNYCHWQFSVKGSGLKLWASKISPASDYVVGIRTVAVVGTQGRLIVSSPKQRTNYGSFKASFTMLSPG